MYQVVEMYGDWEPWWFIEEWEKDVTKKQNFEHFEDALSAYETEWGHLKAALPSYKSRQNLLAAFWNKEDKRWCDDCNEYLQQYHSILLLKDGNEVSKDQTIRRFKQHNDDPAHRSSSCAFGK
jgi:hypothetical protein